MPESEMLSTNEALKEDPDCKNLKKEEAYYNEEFHKEMAKVFPTTPVVDNYIKQKWPITAGNPFNVDQAKRRQTRASTHGQTETSRVAE